jgi:hypothetical protein
MSYPAKGDKFRLDQMKSYFFRISSIILANFRVIINEGKSERATGTSKE